MSKHTPAPWGTCEHSWSDTSIYGKNGKYIAKMSIYDEATEENQEVLESEMEANANIIASAPEMLEALKEILDESDAMFDDDGQILGSINNLAKKAIAKAEGKEMT